MKKFVHLFCVLVLVLTNFYVPEVAKGKTLGDLKTELNEKQAELQANQNKKAQTEAEMNKAKSDVVHLQNNIKQTYTDIGNLEKEIEKLNEDISKKQNEIKEIINFVQVSNGESAYLEYAFGATDFTDFIYRVAISEQMTNYNESLIDQFNQAIEDSKEKQEAMRKKQGEMADQQQQLESKMLLLGEEVKAIASTEVSIEDSIQYQKDIIKIYESKGCTNNESIATCGRKVLPEGTAFYRPTNFGQVTSEFGTRYLVGDWHEGIDTGVPQGTTVYAIGTGQVALIVPRSSKGGNMVVVHHNINGRTYTSVYAHLLSINVVVDQVVNRNTVIGLSGGGKSTMAPSNVCNIAGGTGWDQYTCGEHLHLTLATGLYGLDYRNWTYELNRKYAINPRTMINFPAFGARWNDRMTAY